MIATGAPRDMCDGVNIDPLASGIGSVTFHAEVPDAATVGNVSLLSFK